MSVLVRSPRKGLISLAAVLTVLAVGGQAAAADAATVRVTPLITGKGTVTGAGAACTNSTSNETTTLNCGQRTFSNSTLVIVNLVPAAGSSPPGHWSFAGWSGCPSVVGTTCRIIAFSSQITTVAPRAIFNDSVGPTVSSATPVFSTTVDRGVSFSVSGNEPLASASCRVDGAAGQACNQVRQFAEGTHTVRVQGSDVNGNTGPLSGTLATFQVIDTRLVSGPPDFSAAKRPTFRFATVAGIDFQCSLDGAVFADCGGPGGQQQTFTPASDLAEGAHTFRIRAVDGPDFDRVPIVRTWTVDTVAPDTSLSSPTLPEGVVTTLLEAAFTLGSTESLGRFECKLDSAAFSTCTSPRTLVDLAFGAHNFQVRAVDRAGNVDATPAERNWTITAKDEDNDGFNQRSDCNDANPNINPSRPEILDNAVDENCDGVAGINLDRDGDGATRPADCNDGNPNIRPGAADLPNNGIDEDCLGGDLVQLEEVVVTLARSFSAFNDFTRLTRLQVKNVPAGSTVRATCKFKRKKCPKKIRKAFIKRNAFGTVSLKKFLRRKLKVGTTITVTVTKPGAIGAVKILRIRKAKEPLVTDRCLPPGARNPVAC